MSGSGRRDSAKNLQPTLASNNQYDPTDKSAKAMSERVRSLSALLLDLDEKRLQQTFRTMLGRAASENTALSNPDLPKISELQNGSVNFTEAYRHVGGLIDALNGDPKLLYQTGIEDLLYRLTVMLMRPDIFVGEALISEAPLQLTTLDQLCRYIELNISKRISMTDLEMISGLSSRTLQYQFKNRFGCSPMRWIAQRRLDACRNRLLKPKPGDTVTSVALKYGFTNLGNFARLYAGQFDELPSATLLKARSGI